MGPANPARNQGEPHGRNLPDRMFLGGEAVYAAIERGEYTTPGQVEAALIDAHVTASEETTNG